MYTCSRAAKTVLTAAERPAGNPRCVSARALREPLCQSSLSQCGDAVWFENQGNLSVSGMSISNENPGTGSGCVANGAFGLGLHAVANSTFTNVTVDATGAYGRPFKTTAARWNTFNSLTVENG